MRTTPVRGHTRLKPAHPIYNETSRELMAATGFVPDWFRPRIRVKAPSRPLSEPLYDPQFNGDGADWKQKMRETGF